MGYRFFVLASVGWYILPGWIVPLAAQAGQSGAWYLADLWLVRPQTRLLLLVLPSAIQWPGPISGPLEMRHRIFFSIFYGLLGWIGASLVCRQYSDKSVRVWWLGIYWAATFLFMQLVVFLMMYFGVLPRG